MNEQMFRFVLSNVQRCLISAILEQEILNSTLFMRDAALPVIIKKRLIFFAGRVEEGLLPEFLEEMWCCSG